MLGADSTSSVPSNQGFHFFDFNQKLFEIGESSTLGLLTWGLGGLGNTSYRTLVANLADSLRGQVLQSVDEVAEIWISRFLPEYKGCPAMKEFKRLDAAASFGSKSAAGPIRSEEEERQWNTLKTGLEVGFCIAGYVDSSRIPQAVAIDVFPSAPFYSKRSLDTWSLHWWGVPNFFLRLLRGADGALLSSIESSGKWQGNRQDLEAILNDHTILPAGALPIRDAIDYVHTCIYSTIKAIKFSGLPQVCGGPIEIAVITTDRKFRWVRHKAWDAAITDGALI